MQFSLGHFVQDGFMAALAVAFLVWIFRKHLDAYLGEKGKIRAQIEDIQRITRLTEEARLEFIERTSFLEQKGKQAATKQDIEEITRQIESIKLELSKQGTTHRLRMEKEFEVLSKAWNTLAELRFATQGLFPSGFQPRHQGQDQINVLNKRHEAFNEAYDDYLNAIEKNRPFIPRELRKLLFELLGQAKQVEVNFRYGIDSATGHLKPRAYEDAKPILESFAALAENTSQQIDDRLNA
jgi:hypothetical protein